MSLLIRSFKRRAFLLPIIALCLMYFCHVWDPMCLIVPTPKTGFIDLTEIIAPMLAMVPISFLLSNNYEIELALTCGVSTARLTFVNFFVILIYTLIPCYLTVGLYQYKVFYPDPSDRIRIPIVIPENYKMYMLLSVTVTVLFFAAVTLFLRVLMRNQFTPVILTMVLHLFFGGRNGAIHGGGLSIRQSLFDPFVSNYLLGDTVPNTYYTGIQNYWTYNRLLFTGIAVVLLLVTYLVLRREKLHESFGE